MTTAIAYTRVSSDDQVRGTSLPMQLSEIKTYCDTNDITIVAHYEDAGESAKTADRPGLISALEACRKRKADYLVVHRIDRLSRNATDGLAIRTKLGTHKTKLVSVSEPVSDEPAGQFMSAIMFAAAQFDNDIRSARSRSGMSAITAKGGWNYHAPFGFKIARREDGLPVLEISTPVASELTRLLKTYATGGSSLTATVAGFKAIGFDRGKAYRIFREPVYGGILRTKLSAQDILAAFPGFISPELWYKLEARYTEDKRQPRRDRPSDHGFYLSICTCSICGSRLKGSYSRNRVGALYPYYRCPNGHVSLRASHLEEAVEKSLNSLIVLSSKLKSAVEYATNKLRQLGHDRQKIEKQRQTNIKSYRDKLSSLAEKYIDEEVDQSTYRALQAKYNGKIADLEADALQISDSLDFFDRAVRIHDAFLNIVAIWRHMTIDQRKKLLLSLPNPPKYNIETKKVEHNFDQAGINKTAFSKGEFQMAPLMKLTSNMEAVCRALIAC